jgi:hypothetical protein
MNKLKTMIAGWLRAAADKIDPKPVTTQDGPGPWKPNT